jgi:hypothetical protein
MNLHLHNCSRFYDFLNLSESIRVQVFSEGQFFIDEIFQLIWHLISKQQIKDGQIFEAFLENLNCKGG